MHASRFAGGLVAASFAVLLFLGIAPASARAAPANAPWWAAPPVPDFRLFPSGGRVPPRPLAAWGSPAAWRAAQGYRWRPIEAPRMAPPPFRTAWVPRPGPIRPFVAPAAVAAYPPPWTMPRFADSRTPAPVTVTIDGTPYRFRPAAPVRWSSLAQGPRRPGPVGYAAYAPGPSPLPAQRSRWTAPPPGLAWSVLPPSQPWARPVAWPRDAWYGYRFRPDSRFASSAPGGGASGPWIGQAQGADGWQWAYGSERRAVPGRTTEPRPLSGGAVAYVYD